MKTFKKIINEEIKFEKSKGIVEEETDLNFIKNALDECILIYLTDL